jgi:putative tryptophan/tyrosine transport system substrate-binding protein
MERREFITLLSGTAAAWPLVARAQQAGKVWRIGILDTTSVALNAANFDALRQGLRQHGYIEGQNLVIDYRSADGRVERFPDLAAELVHLKVDLIVTRGTPAVVAVKNATKTIPVVMAASGDPIGAGVVAGLARPGANVTGLSAFVTELQAKRLELLKELVPGINRIAALLNMSSPATPPQWEQTKAAARTLAIEPQLLDVRKPEDLNRAFETAIRQRAEALVVGINALTQANRRPIADLATKHRLPAIYASREFVDAGGLVAFGVNYPDLYRRAATYVDKILKGAKPADLPIEQPTKFEMVINLKTAKALGLDVPPTLLARADEVIE